MERKAHFAALDGLRGVAALAVVLLHAAEPFGLTPIPSAALAVDFFFLLSGFVVAFAYEDRLRTTMTFGQFVRARIIRLHPLILAGLGLGILVYLAKLRSQGGDVAPLAWAAAAGALLIPTGVLKQPGYSASQPLNTPAWSLLAEYVVNFAYAGLLRFLTNRVLAVLIAAGAAADVALAAHYRDMSVGSSYDLWWAGLIRVIFPFFAGVAIFRLWRGGRIKAVSAPVLVTALALLAVLLLPADWRLQVTATLVAFPLIVAAATEDRMGSRVRGLCLWAGQISYPIYILHYPFVRVFSNYARSHNFSGGLLAAVIACEIIAIVLVAAVALKVYDEPARKWLARLARTPRPSERAL